MFAGFVSAVVGVATFAATGSIHLSFATAGATYGGIMGGFNGGITGAIQGAGVGFVTGSAMGAGFAQWGPPFLAVAAIASATYAGVTGGLEGLADFAGGAIGSTYGYALGSALFSSSSLGQAGTESEGTLSSSEQQQIKEQLSAGQLENPLGNNHDNTPTILKNQEKADIIVDSAIKGEVGTGSNPQSRLDNIKQRACNVLSKHQEIHNNITESVRSLALDSAVTRKGLAVGGAAALKTGLAFLKCSALCFAYGPEGWPAGVAMGFLGVETIMVGIDIWIGLWKAQTLQPESQ